MNQKNVTETLLECQGRVTMQTLKGDGASMMLSLEEEAIGHNEKL